MNRKYERYDVLQFTHLQTPVIGDAAVKITNPHLSREHQTLQHLLGDVQGLLNGSTACQYLIVLVHVKIESLAQ